MPRKLRQVRANFAREGWKIDRQTESHQLWKHPLLPGDELNLAGSEEDQTYIVSFPEWGDLLHTHGDTYAEAVQNGEELLEGLIESRRQHGEPLPQPRLFVAV